MSFEAKLRHDTSPYRKRGRSWEEVEFLVTGLDT